MRKKKHDISDPPRLEYTKARNMVSKLMRQSKRKFESEVAKKSNTNPKAFWRHVNGKLKTRVGVSPLLEDENDKESMKFSDIEKANILQKQFCSVFTNEPESDIPSMPCKTYISISTLKLRVTW